MRRSRRTAAAAVVRAGARSVLATGLGLAIGALGLAGCDQEAPRGVASPDVPDTEVRQFSLTESVNGRLRWRLTARSASSFRTQGLIQAKDVTIDFFDDGGVRYSRLTANEGEIRTATNDMSANGDVRITTANGTRVETPSLRFQNREQRIVSDDRVTVWRGGDVLTGVGFVSDPTLEHFEFRRSVRAKVQTSSGRLQVRARDESP
jgi:LPS export ABC transporter protein LptC